MTVATIIRIAPRPYPPAMIAALSLLAIWSLGQWRDAVLMGRVLDPLGPAVTLRFALQLVYNICRRGDRLLALIQAPVTTFVLGLGFVVLVGAGLWVNDPWLCKLGWSLYFGTLGLIMLFIALHWPEDLTRMPTAFAGLDSHSEGAHVIIALSHIGLAIGGGILARFGTEMGWVLFASVGQIAWLILTNWIVVSWLLSQPPQDG